MMQMETVYLKKIAEKYDYNFSERTKDGVF